MADMPGAGSWSADRRPAAAPGRLQRVLEGGEVAVTAEIGPPRGADIEPVRRKAALLADWVDAVNITDNQGASVRLAGWAASLAALSAGVAPIMQLTCRDRNRIALQSELIAASAMGIPNVLLMTGDEPGQGDHADAKPVFDLNSIEFLRAAAAMRDEGRLLSGRAIDPRPSWFLGAVVTPAAADNAAAAGITRLAAKVGAGAQFVQTQFVFDVPAFAAWMARARGLGLHERCHILAGTGPVMSLAALTYLQHRLPGVHVPRKLADRLQAADRDGIAAVGARLCAEIIGGLRQIPGVAGIHVMAPGREEAIPGILADAGMTARTGPGTRAQPADRASAPGPAADPGLG